MKKIFQTVPVSDRASLGLLLLRLVAGLAFVLHGWGKIQTPFSWMGPESTTPGFLQFLAAISEFGGGICWILGLLTPLASLGAFFTMAYATYFHAVVRGDPFVGGKDGSYELALLFLTIAVHFILTGPGRYSVDRKIFG